MNTFTSKALLKKLRSKKKAMVQTVQALGDSLSSKLQPDRYSGHQCPIHDPWGVYGHNYQNYTALGGACMPDVAWTQTKYQFSNPDAWMYDINNIKGWGDHPDY